MESAGWDAIRILSATSGGLASIMIVKVCDMVQKGRVERLAAFKEAKGDAARAALQSVTARDVTTERCLMVFALVLFAGGLYGLIHEKQGQANVHIEVTPMEPEYPPVVYARATKLALNQDGVASTVLENNDHLSVRNEDMHKRMQELSVQLNAARAAEKRAATSVAKNAPDAGFGSLFSGE